MKQIIESWKGIFKSGNSGGKDKNHKKDKSDII